MDQAKAGAFLAQLRKDAGLTQAQLGDIVGVSNKTISRWETGSYMPDLDNCLALSEQFGVTVNELLIGQRMDDGEIRQTANQVLVEAVRSETFSIHERTRYWKKKWLREHWLQLVMLAAWWLSMLALVYFHADWLGQWKPLAGGILCLMGVCAYGWQRNRMMIYVEDKLYGDREKTDRQ